MPSRSRTHWGEVPLPGLLGAFQQFPQRQDLLGLPHDSWVVRDVATGTVTVLPSTEEFWARYRSNRFVRFIRELWDWWV